MLSFLLFILIFVVVIGLVIILSVIGFVSSIFRGIFSFGRRTGNQSQDSTGENQQKPTKKEKVLFDKSEAQDADYEEIK